jgi:3-methyl-2-oxobutanoate hydroxymethyltransferase
MKRKLTVKDLLATKGKRKLSMTTVFDHYTAKAAELAGIDLVGRGGDNIEEMCLSLDDLRKGAPNTPLIYNIPVTHAYVSESETIRIAMLAMKHGADIIACSGNDISRFKAMAKLGIPCMGHVGLVPIRSTWVGGLKAVGKTTEEAMQVYRDTVAFQEAGAIAVEMECVPERIAAEITKRVDILTISLGSGRYCDAQFLFSCDILGNHDGHYPRHSKRYRDFYGETVKAFQEFRKDVDSGQFPADGHCVKVDDEQYQGFLDIVDSK